jgi:hypothetical protein
MKLFVQLTSDIQVDRVAHAVALGVVRGAGVDPRVGSGHLLEDQTLVADDHLLLHVVDQLTTLE